MRLGFEYLSLLLEMRPPFREAYSMMVYLLKKYPYPKIEDFYRRDRKGRLTWFVRRREFVEGSVWIATEKIDGVNVRLVFWGRNMVVWGRRWRTWLPGKFLLEIHKRYEWLVEAVDSVFELSRNKDKVVILYGEGVGYPFTRRSRYYTIGGEWDVIFYDLLVTDLKERLWEKNFLGWFEFLDAVKELNSLMGVCLGCRFINVPRYWTACINSAYEMLTRADPERFEGFVMRSFEKKFYSYPGRPLARLMFKYKIESLVENGLLEVFGR